MRDTQLSYIDPDTHFKVHFMASEVLNHSTAQTWQMFVEDLQGDKWMEDDELDRGETALRNMRTRTLEAYKDVDTPLQRRHNEKVFAVVDWTMALVVKKREAINTTKIRQLDIDGYTPHEIVSFGHNRELVEAVLGG